MPGTTPDPVAVELANLDSLTRQAEINEWSYRNKMDTLFVFQLLFLAITFLTILMYFRSMGVLNMKFIMLIAGILVGLLILVIVNRSQYTNKVRDNRLWNKRKFSGDNQKGSQLQIPPSVARAMDDYYLRQERQACSPPAGAPSGMPVAGVLPSSSPAIQLSNLQFTPDTIKP